METITTGKRLKALREDRGLSQSQLAKKADINSRVLQTYEQDDRDIAGAKLKTLLKVCVALECRLEDIVTDDETLALIASYNRRPAGRPFFYFTEGSPWGNTSAT